MAKKPQRQIKKIAQPFLLLDSDPALKASKARKSFIRGKTIKYLTILDPPAIMKRVNKLKNERTTKMPKDKTKKSRSSLTHSVAWLVFATQQAFVGIVLLKSFDNYFVVAGALISLAIAGSVVLVHFFKAHK